MSEEVLRWIGIVLGTVGFVFMTALWLTVLGDRRKRKR